MLQENTLFDNNYLLKRLIGRGGFAEVWLAEHTLTHLEEALKIYAPGTGLDDDGVKMFIKELTLVHDLRHTNLLTAKIMGQYDRQPYLVLPYCPNGPLTKKIGNISEDEIWKLLRQVASGLAYLHEKGIIHQDIKPDNILIDANGDYVITDFGISQRMQSTLRKSMREQAASGTTGYMAPERYMSPNPSKECDVWSLGAMLFELLEGVVPFNTPIGSLAQQNGAPIPEISASVSDELKTVITSMLALNGDLRPTAAQLAELKSGAGFSASSSSQADIQAGDSAPRAGKETRRIDLEQMRRAEEEAKRKAEEAKRKAEEEARRAAREEADRKAKKKAEREAREAAKRREAEEEQRRNKEQVEAAWRAEMEAQRRDKEAKRKAEEEAFIEKTRQEAKEAPERQKAKEEERKKAEADAKRKAEAERKKAETEAKRKAEEAERRAADSKCFVSPTSLTIGSGKEEFSIQAKGELKISAYPSWLTVTAGLGRFIVTSESNPEKEPRTGEISFRTPLGRQLKVEVTQEGKKSRKWIWWLLAVILFIVAL